MKLNVFFALCTEDAMEVASSPCVDSVGCVVPQTGYGLRTVSTAFGTQPPSYGASHHSVQSASVVQAGTAAPTAGCGQLPVASSTVTSPCDQQAYGQFFLFFSESDYWTCSTLFPHSRVFTDLQVVDGSAGLRTAAGWTAPIVWTTGVWTVHSLGEHCAGTT